MDRVVYRISRCLIKILRQKLHRMICRKSRRFSPVWMILGQVDHIMKERCRLQNAQIGSAFCLGNLLAQGPDPPQMPQVMRTVLRIIPDPQYLRLISDLCGHFFCKCT